MAALNQFNITDRVFWKGKFITTSKCAGLGVHQIIRCFRNRIFGISHCIKKFKLLIGYLFIRLRYFAMIRRTGHASSARWCEHVIDFVLLAQLFDLKLFHILVVVDYSVIDKLKRKNIFAFLCRSALSDWILLGFRLRNLPKLWLIRNFFLTGWYGLKVIN